MATKKKYTLRNYGEYIKDNPKGFWFKRKLYGWGWVPVTWEGWTVILIFIALLVVNAIYFDYNIALNNGPSTKDMMVFFSAIIVSIIVIFWICYKKGEKPKWSWGR